MCRKEELEKSEENAERKTIVSSWFEIPLEAPIRQ
jgi:hypothetical protein